MASSFQITSTTNSILLDEQRHGKAVFSVYNRSGQPIRGRARLAADKAANNSAAITWLSVVGAVEREFATASRGQ